MTLTIVAIVAFAAGFAAGTSVWMVLVRWQKSQPAPAPHRPREALRSKGEPVQQGFVTGTGVTAEDVDEMSDVVIAARLATHRKQEQEKHARLIRAGDAIRAERESFGERSREAWA